MFVLPERDRRALMVALVVIPTIVGVRMSLPLVSQWQAVAIARADVSSRALATARATAALAGRYGLALDSLRPAVDLYERAIQVNGSIAPLAEFAAAVSGHARRADIAVASTDLLPPRQFEPHYVLLRLRIQGVTDSRGLEVFLRNLTQDSRQLRICTLSIVQTEPLAKQELPEFLRVDATVCRLVKRGEQETRR